MGKGEMSIGDDTPTGEPENGPRGPYITDKDDGTRRRRLPRTTAPAKQGAARRTAISGGSPTMQPPSRTETEITKKSELGSDR